MAICEHRLSQRQARPAIIVGRGKYSADVCNLLLHDGNEIIAPMCKAPDASTQSCPVAKYYRGEIDMNTAHGELDEIHGESYAK